jgi:hypothetical protein
MPADRQRERRVMASKKPAHEVRLGRIRAAIWLNQSEDEDVWFNVTLTRLYREGNQWKDSTSFRKDDLPVASKALDMAYAWIWGQAVLPEPEEAENGD